MSFAIMLHLSLIHISFANNYSALFAAVVMTVLPTIVIFIILQKQVMESLTAGAVKE